MPMQYAIYMHLRTKKSKTIQFSKNTNINSTVLFRSICTFGLHLPNSYYSFFTKIFERKSRKKICSMQIASENAVARILREILKIISAF